MIVAFERFREWIQGDSSPTLRASEWIESITRQVNSNTILSGSGSPEGVITAEPKALYMDTAGSSGSIMYIKQTGAGNTGWILV